MDSIPIARSNSFLLCNQRGRLVIGGLCSLFRPRNDRLAFHCTHSNVAF